MTRTHDVHGREYAKLSKLRPGDFVIVDDGFTCMKKWSKREVLTDGNELYLRCKSATHLLDGQLEDDGDTLIGIYPA